ncbi:hypothetical protein DCS_05454 [Drechmeria coniospora]|uniref:Uncharacterized protein n=1 Tax=Drechmeria coniospora TaxID=98403 RepID=A0A151GMY5_DRECN|nr:hypothetical protein DCS_05454 [Drechmeria coniospora]KYK58438.1 hypothetical protein DCS_05454 [Drechmeria coniospora]
MATVKPCISYGAGLMFLRAVPAARRDTADGRRAGCACSGAALAVGSRFWPVLVARSHQRLHQDEDRVCRDGS